MIFLMGSDLQTVLEQIFSSSVDMLALWTKFIFINTQPDTEILFW